jgi:hypothetical protein
MEVLQNSDSIRPLTCIELDCITQSPVPDSAKMRYPAQAKVCIMHDAGHLDFVSKRTSSMLVEKRFIFSKGPHMIHF